MKYLLLSHIYSKFYVLFIEINFFSLNVKIESQSLKIFLTHTLNYLINIKKHNGQINMLNRLHKTITNQNLMNIHILKIQNFILMTISVNQLIFISLTLLISTNSIRLNTLQNVQPSARPARGERLFVKSSNFTLYIPVGWRVESGAHEKEMHIFSPDMKPHEDMIRMWARDLESNEKNMNIKDLLMLENKLQERNYPAPLNVTVVIQPQEIKLKDLEAAKFIGEANPFGDQVFEGYSAAIKNEDKDKVMFLHGIYSKDKSEKIRPGLDLILNSIKECD
jgi:hypothetical protein